MFLLHEASAGYRIQKIAEDCRTENYAAGSSERKNASFINLWIQMNVTVTKSRFGRVCPLLTLVKKEVSRSSGKSAVSSSKKLGGMKLRLRRRPAVLSPNVRPWETIINRTFQTKMEEIF